MTSSLGAPLDPKAVKPVNGEYVLKHSENHLDCLVGGHKILDKKNFAKEVKEFINNIRPLEIVSFPGLNTKRLLGGVWTDTINPVLKFPTYLTPAEIPGESFKNKTIANVIQQCNDKKYIGFIYGSNNRNFFEKKLPPREGVKMLFKELNVILQNTKFEAVFISTIFPRDADINEKGELMTNIKEFNDILLSPQSKLDNDFKIIINTENDEKRLIKWEVVDITQILPYEDINNDVHFCEQNKTKRRKDKVHVNGKVLFKFYMKLDTAIKKYKRKKYKYRNKKLSYKAKRKQKKGLVSENANI